MITTQTYHELRRKRNTAEEVYKTKSDVYNTMYQDYRDWQETHITYLRHISDFTIKDRYYYIGPVLYFENFRKIKFMGIDAWREMDSKLWNEVQDYRDSFYMPAWKRYNQAEKDVKNYVHSLSKDEREELLELLKREW